MYLNLELGAHGAGNDESSSEVLIRIVRLETGLECHRDEAVPHPHRWRPEFSLLVREHQTDVGPLCIWNEQCCLGSRGDDREDLDRPEVAGSPRDRLRRGHWRWEERHRAGMDRARRPVARQFAYLGVRAIAERYSEGVRPWAGRQKCRGAAGKQCCGARSRGGEQHESPGSAHSNILPSVHSDRRTSNGLGVIAVAYR